MADVVDSSAIPSMISVSSKPEPNAASREFVTFQEEQITYIIQPEEEKRKVISDDIDRMTAANLNPEVGCQAKEDTHTAEKLQEDENSFYIQDTDELSKLGPAKIGEQSSAEADSSKHQSSGVVHPSGEISQGGEVNEAPLGSLLEKQEGGVELNIAQASCTDTTVNSNESAVQKVQIFLMLCICYSFILIRNFKLVFMISF